MMERILVAYDGGEPARRALGMAIDLAKKYEASITVVSVVPVHTGRIAVDPWDDAPLHAKELLEAKQILLDHGIEADFVEPAGDPAKTIERIAERGHFDTVIVGSRGLDPVSRFFQGSVSEHVAANSKATVIVAR